MVGLKNFLIFKSGCISYYEIRFNYLIIMLDGFGMAEGKLSYKPYKKGGEKFKALKKPLYQRV